MKALFKLSKVIILSLVMGFFCIQIRPAYAEEVLKASSADTGTTETPKKNGDLKTSLVTDKEAVKQIETKQEEKAVLIKEAVKDVEQVKSEAQRLIEEKKAVEKQAEAKIQEAVAVKEEAKVVLAEAIRTGDSQGKKKAAELTEEARMLEEEARVAKERAKAMELKAQANEQKISANVIAIEAMKKEFEELRKEKQSKRGLINKLIYGGVIILIGLFLMWLLSNAIKRFEHIVTEKDAIRESEGTLRLKTLSGLLKWLGSLIIVGFVTYMVFENFGIDMSPLLAGAGILGLAFGFGGQYLIRDVINGVFILMEGQYRINDVIKIGETSGLVENINLRMTKLRDLEGRVIYIPNGEIKTVINFTQDYAHALLKIGVAYKENIDRVITVIKEVAESIKEDKYFGKLILEPLEMLGVDDFADSQVTIKCRFKTLPIKQWEVAREFRRRLKNKFDEVGIEIPFPHRTLYWGAGEENKWLKDTLIRPQR